MTDCRAVMGLARSSYYRVSKPRDRGELGQAIKEIAGKFPTYGSRRIKAQLERGFALLDEEFPALLQPNLHDYDDLERRIDTLFRGKERKELPESLREYIPSLWARPPSRSNPPNRQPIAPAPITATERVGLFIVDFSFDHFL